MAFTLTFLGKGGTGRSTLAIAAARQMAQLNRRVLLVSDDPLPAFRALLGRPVTPTNDPQDWQPGIQVAHLAAVTLLERNWEELKALEAKYLRSPFFKEVYGQELAILPGLDRALTLNALRQFDDSGQYDTIIYDGAGDLTTLRMFGLPETLSWYVRRFRQVIDQSDIAKAVSPFIQPVSSAIFTNSAGDAGQQPMNEATGLLDSGRQILSDPARIAAYLVTTPDEVAIATAEYLWGSAQVHGLTVGGVLVNRCNDAGAVAERFQPLAATALPEATPETLATALPEVGAIATAPRPMEINIEQQQVKLFLPGFSKADVKLCQSGPEVTVEAGDQRRNILLPAPLAGKAVAGAKFQDRYLILSF